MARIRARALAPLAGVVYVGLMVAVLSLPSSPDSKAGGAKLITFYREHHTSTRVSEFMLAYAAIAVVVFFASLATYLRQRGAQVLASTTVAGAVVMAAGLCLAAGVTEAGVDQYKRLSDSAAQTLNLLQNDAFAILLFAGLALAVTSAGVSMLLTKAMHKAIGIITVVIGVAAATGFASWIGFMASGLLTLFLAVYLFREYNRPDEITLPEVAATAQVPAEATAVTEQPTTG